MTLRVRGGPGGGGLRSAPGRDGRRARRSLWLPARRGVPGRQERARRYLFRRQSAPAPSAKNLLPCPVFTKGLVGPLNNYLCLCSGPSVRGCWA